VDPRMTGSDGVAMGNSYPFRPAAPPIGCVIYSAGRVIDDRSAGKSRSIGCDQRRVGYPRRNEAATG
jgi:hypothetical protein